MPMHARHGLRTVNQHTVVVDDVDNGAHLAHVRTIADQTNAADLDEAGEAHRNLPSVIAGGG